jgi:hypothetical protein
MSCHVVTKVLELEVQIGVELLELLELLVPPEVATSLRWPTMSRGGIAVTVCRGSPETRCIA